MMWNFTPSSVPLIIGAIILIISGVLVLRRSPTLTNTYLAIVNILIAIFSGAYGLELLQTSFKGVFFWQRVGLTGGVSTPVFLLLLLIAYYGPESLLTGVNHLILLTIPAITIGFSWTSRYHEFLYINPHIVKTGSIYMLDYVPGWWHWVYIAYVFIIVILSVTYLLSSYVRRAGAFRSQVITLLVGISLPSLTYGFFWVVELLHLPIPKYSWQAYAFIITGLIMTFSLHNSDIFRIGPVAYDAIFKNIEEAIVVLDEHNRIIDLNPTVIRILNWDRRSVIGKNLLDVLSSSALEVIRPYLDASDTQGEIVLGDYYLDLKITSFKHQLQKHAGRLIVLRDITQRVGAEQHLKYIATHDAVTNLPNRALFNEKLRYAVARAEKLGKAMVLLFIDLDNFKGVNDHFGHAKGDWLLQDVATRIGSVLRESDTVARWGGDEFAVILETVSKDEDIQLTIERIQQATNFQLDDGECMLPISTSIGVSIFPDHGKDIKTLMKFADAAMYEAKKAGKNSYMIHGKGTQVGTANR